MQHNVPPESATRHAKFVPSGDVSMCTRTRQGRVEEAVCPETTDRNNYQQEPRKRQTVCGGNGLGFAGRLLT